MIRIVDSRDFETVWAIINDAATAYAGVIPSDCYHAPYMPREYLRHEIDVGVEFSGYEDGGELVGVMGFQNVQDVSLIRHAYVRTDRRNRGIGGQMLKHLQAQATRPLLVGTWKAAVWAIGLYQKHGFRLVTHDAKERLLRKYWAIPERQIETSVVLADATWLANHRADAEVETHGP